MALFITYVLDSVLLKQIKFFWAYRPSNQIKSTSPIFRGNRKTVASTSRLFQFALFACARLCIHFARSRKYKNPSRDTDPVLTLLQNSGTFFCISVFFSFGFYQVFIKRNFFMRIYMHHWFIAENFGAYKHTFYCY